MAGFAISAIMAAIMSSSAGFLLSATSSLGRDIYSRFFRRGAGEREQRLVTRLCTGVLGLVALGLALSTDPNDKRSAVYSLVLYAWGGLSGCFSAPVVMALYSKSITRAGCIAGMVAWEVTILAWHKLPALAGVIHELTPAVMLSAMSIVLVSRPTRDRKAAP